MRLTIFRDYGWLLYSLVIRDLRGRYKGSVLGFFWTFLNPLLLMLTYSIVFGYFLQVNAPAYPVFILSGLLPWIWFSTALLQGSTSILEGASYVGKTIFPTPVLPLVPVLAGMVNYLLSLPLLLLLLLAFRLPLGWGLVCFPVLVLIQALLLSGLTMALSALSVTFRDTQHLLGHIVTILFFMMPIMYPLTAIPERARWIVEHNPLVGLFTATSRYSIMAKSLTRAGCCGCWCWPWRCSTVGSSHSTGSRSPLPNTFSERTPAPVVGRVGGARLGIFASCAIPFFKSKESASL